MKSNGINTNALKAALAFRGVTQKTVAELSGLSLPQFNQIINGNASANLSTVQKIAKALKLTNDEFSQIFYNQKGGE